MKRQAPRSSSDLRIIQGDIRRVRGIPDESIDLIVTSPPYNVSIRYGQHDDASSYEEYLRFSQEWMGACRDLVRPDGRFCLNVPLDKNKGGQQSVYADLTDIAKRLGWRYQSTIVWNEQNISRRTAWGSWKSASAPYVIAPVEMIAVFYKRDWKKRSGSGRSDISRDEFLAWTNGVWTFNGESKKRVGHPAPFPVELPRRCLKLFTFVGDTVLDPFLGSGTTLVAAQQTQRRGVGVEIDPEYCRVARQRLQPAPSVS